MILLFLDEIQYFYSIFGGYPQIHKKYPQILRFYPHFSKKYSHPPSYPQVYTTKTRFNPKNPRKKYYFFSTKYYFFSTKYYFFST